MAKHFSQQTSVRVCIYGVWYMPYGMGELKDPIAV